MENEDKKIIVNEQEISKEQLEELKKDKSKLIKENEDGTYKTLNKMQG